MHAAEKGEDGGAVQLRGLREDVAVGEQQRAQAAGDERDGAAVAEVLDDGGGRGRGSGRGGGRLCGEDSVVDRRGGGGKGGAVEEARGAAERNAHRGNGRLCYGGVNWWMDGWLPATGGDGDDRMHRMDGKLIVGIQTRHTCMSGLTLLVPARSFLSLRQHMFGTGLKARCRRVEKRSLFRIQ